MLGERSVFYDKQPKKRRVVLNIEHIKNPRGLRIARWWCSELAKFNDKAMEQMKVLTEQLYSRERELEHKDRQETIDQYQERMKKILKERDPKINQLVAEGHTVEEAIKKLQNITR
jgi:flagellar motility protein MotE (MotC chaperone)